MTDADRPLKDVFVLDSTVHGYNTTPANYVDSPYRDRVAAQLADTLYNAHRMMVPDGNVDRWTLPKDRFQHGHDPDLLGSALFAESDTDVAVYHGVPMYGIYRDGGSPLWVGKAMRERWPNRVALYGGVSPWQPNALEELERLVVEDGVVGIKLYPMDIVDGRIVSYRLDDPEVAYPLLERAQSLGVRMIAMHKALPQGQVPSEPFQVVDVAGAASAFPDLVFEVVHGGLAYVEETAWQLQRFPNVTVNLENSSAFLLYRQPRRFAQVLGEFMLWGGTDRIFWSSGVTARHPQPFLELFWNFQMPAELCEQFGYPELDDHAKCQILGLNHARFLGWDIDQLRARLAEDEFGSRNQLADPWSAA